LRITRSSFSSLTFSNACLPFSASPQYSQRVAGKKRSDTERRGTAARYRHRSRRRSRPSRRRRGSRTGRGTGQGTANRSRRRRSPRHTAGCAAGRRPGTSSESPSTVEATQAEFGDLGIELLDTGADVTRRQDGDGDLGSRTRTKFRDVDVLGGQARADHVVRVRHQLDARAADVRVHAACAHEQRLPAGRRRGSSAASRPGRCRRGGRLPCGRSLRTRTGIRRSPRGCRGRVCGRHDRATRAPRSCSGQARSAARARATVEGSGSGAQLGDEAVELGDGEAGEDVGGLNRRTQAGQHLEGGQGRTGSRAWASRPRTPASRAPRGTPRPPRPRSPPRPCARSGCSWIERAFCAARTLSRNGDGRPKRLLRGRAQFTVGSAATTASRVVSVPSRLQLRGRRGVRTHPQLRLRRALGIVQAEQVRDRGRRAPGVRLDGVAQEVPRPVVFRCRCPADQRTSGSIAAQTNKSAR